MRYRLIPLTRRYPHYWEISSRPEVSVPDTSVSFFSCSLRMEAESLPERFVMPLQLKKIADQTVVTTAATSGIGLATARLAASRGANLVLAARDAQALERAVADLDIGDKAMSAPVDVADYKALQELTAKAAERFGAIDTWINNAGVSIFWRHEEVRMEDQRRLFDTNYWDAPPIKFRRCLAYA